MYAISYQSQLELILIMMFLLKSFASMSLNLSSTCATPFALHHALGSPGAHPVPAHSCPSPQQSRSIYQNHSNPILSFMSLVSVIENDFSIGLLCNLQTPMSSRRQRVLFGFIFSPKPMNSFRHLPTRQAVLGSDQRLFQTRAYRLISKYILILNHVLLFAFFLIFSSC